MDFEAPQEDLVRKLKESFARAEKMESRSSLQNAKISTASINQLRYAGFHTLKAHQGGGSWDEEELKQAIGHCKRAYSDSVASLITSLMACCDEFPRMYIGVKEVLDVIPDYNDRLVEMQEARIALSEYVTRAKQADTPDADHYDPDYIERQIKSIEPHIEKLENTKLVFQLAAPQIDALMKSGWRLTWFKLIVTAILGVVAGFLLKC